MQAGRRRRSRRLGALGVGLVAAVVGVCASLGSSASAQPPARTSAAPAGSSCANPEVTSEMLVPPFSMLSPTPSLHIRLIYLPSGGAQTTEWSVPAGYVICSTRLQLADGSVAPPTYVIPSGTPTPIGGQYDEVVGDPGSALNTITITAAKSPVPPGTNCRYPQESSLIGTVARVGPKSHVSVNVVEVTPTRLQLKLKPHKANLVLCHTAYIFLWLPNPHGYPGQRAVFPVSVKPHGGLSSTVTVPAGSYTPKEGPPQIEAEAFARS